MNTRVEQIIKKVKLQYRNIDTILLFGSALNPDWTEQSDVDIFLIDDSFNDSRSEVIIDGITIEFQEDNFENILKDIESEYGQLLNRNVSTMISSSRIISNKSSEKLTKLIDSAKLTLSSTPVYSEQDVKNVEIFYC